jgi:hypothetical protein
MKVPLHYCWQVWSGHRLCELRNLLMFVNWCFIFCYPWWWYCDIPKHVGYLSKFLLHAIKGRVHVLVCCFDYSYGTSATMCTLLKEPKYGTHNICTGENLGFIVRLYCLRYRDLILTCTVPESKEWLIKIATIPLQARNNIYNYP